MTDKLSEAFSLFDTDNDSSINVNELRDGLANQLKITVTEQQAQKILAIFDKDADGLINLSEFKGIEAFKLKLDQILREEKQASIQANLNAIQAKKEAEKEQQKLAFIEAQINNLPPTPSDRFVSLLPYLLPLADVLPYSKKFIQDYNLGGEDNFVLNFATDIFGVYHSIPLSGLLVFFLLTRLGANLSLNRLVRFNIYQAFQLDIFLIIPDFVSFIAETISKSLQLTIPPIAFDLGSTSVFLGVSLAIIYSLVTSLFGYLPNMLPIISKQAESQIPTSEELLRQLRAMEAEIEANKKMKEDKDRENKLK